MVLNNIMSDYEGLIISVKLLNIISLGEFSA